MCEMLNLFPVCCRLVPKKQHLCCPCSILIRPRGPLWIPLCTRSSCWRCTSPFAAKRQQVPALPCLSREFCTILSVSICASTHVLPVEMLTTQQCSKEHCAAIFSRSIASLECHRAALQETFRLQALRRPARKLMLLLRKSPLQIRSLCCSFCA